jgi:hypothetical protein
MKYLQTTKYLQTMKRLQAMNYLQAMKRNLFPAIILCALVPLMSGMSCEDFLPDGEEDFPDYVEPDPDEPDDPNNPDNPDKPDEPDRIAHDWSWWQNYEWEDPDDYEPDVHCRDTDRYSKKKNRRVKIPSDFPHLLAAIADKEFFPSYSASPPKLPHIMHPEGLFVKNKDGEYCFLHITQWWLEEPEAFIKKRIGIAVYDTAYTYIYVGEGWQVAEIADYRNKLAHVIFRDTLVSRIYVRDESESFATFPTSIWSDGVVYNYEKVQWNGVYDFSLKGFYGTRKDDGTEVFSESLAYPVDWYNGYMPGASWYYPR